MNNCDNALGLISIQLTDGSSLSLCPRKHTQARVHTQPFFAIISVSCIHVLNIAPGEFNLFMCIIHAEEVFQLVSYLISLFFLSFFFDLIERKQIFKYMWHQLLLYLYCNGTPISHEAEQFQCQAADTFSLTKFKVSIWFSRVRFFSWSLTFIMNLLKQERSSTERKSADWSLWLANWFA